MGSMESPWRVWCSEQSVCLRLSVRTVVLLLLAGLGRRQRTVHELQLSHIRWHSAVRGRLVLRPRKEIIQRASSRGRLVAL